MRGDASAPKQRDDWTESGQALRALARRAISSALLQRDWAYIIEVFKLLFRKCQTEKSAFYRLFFLTSILELFVAYFYIAAFFSSIINIRTLLTKHGYRNSLMHCIHIH